VSTYLCFLINLIIGVQSGVLQDLQGKKQMKTEAIYFNKRYKYQII